MYKYNADEAKYQYSKHHLALQAKRNKLHLALQAKRNKTHLALQAKRNTISSTWPGR
jgi:hypothetical protein